MLRVKKCVFGVLISAVLVAGGDGRYDLLQYETPVLLFWNGDDFALRDTILTALSIKTVKRGYRVLTKDGDIFVCDRWKPVREEGAK